MVTTVIDCDSHVMEPADLWQRYLPERHRERGIQIVVQDGVEHLVMDGTTILAGVLAGLGGVHVDRPELFSGRLGYIDGCPPASYDPSERARLLDGWGVDAGLLFPTIGILPFPTEDQELISAHCAAYNTWQADFSGEIPGRTIPVAHLNLADLDGAIAELERCIDLGFRGVFLPPDPIDGKRPGHPDFDPLWARCAEAGVVLCVHVVVRFAGVGVPFPSWYATSPGSTFTFGLGASGQVVPAAVSMVTDGLFDRVPDLRVVCVENGCGWAAHVMDRLDAKHAVLGFTSTIKEKPSEYFRRNLWFVAEPEERTIGAMLDLVGPDRIVWGSDFPHIDSTLEAPEQIRHSVAGLTGEQQAAVLGGNAAGLFGL